MPYIWLKEDELQAVRAVLDSQSRIGQPLDWAAYDRGIARIKTGRTHRVLSARRSRKSPARSRRRRVSPRPMAGGRS
jgi:hypothetical protein